MCSFRGVAAYFSVDILVAIFRANEAI
jgi:hypothetical protein